MMNRAVHYILIPVVVLMFVACSSEKFIPDNGYMLNKVEITSDTKDMDVLLLEPYIRQKANSRWFSFFKIPLATYSLSGRDTTKWINRTLQRMGEQPVVYDTLQARLSCEDLRMAMNNMGYMNASVDIDTKRHGKKLNVIYKLHPNEPFYINNFRYDIKDQNIERLLRSVAGSMPSYANSHKHFTVDFLDRERHRITEILNDSGYYRFHKDFIQYTADSVRGSKDIDVTMHIMGYRHDSDGPEVSHPRYYINKVNFVSPDSTELHLRNSVLMGANSMRQGSYFCNSDLQRTYNNFARLGAVGYTNISFTELPTDSVGLHPLETNIGVTMNKPHAISFQPEGTNTAGDLGAAALLTYQNRNLFRGSELFTVKLRGAFEAITGLEGYDNHDYEEYSVETSLQFPRFVAPFLSQAFRKRSNATSEVALSWDLQNRPEFHRRVFSLAWRYKWSNPKKHTTYNLDLLDLNYVYMPWISSTFKHDYIDSVSNRNVILRYNYEDLLIMKMGIGLRYNDSRQVFRANFETAGNVLSGLSGLFKFKKNGEGQSTFFNIAYAQYVKFDFDYTRIFQIDNRNQFVLHGDFGIAWPYGNSTVLPFEKRYFSGGPNSVRGWSVRELGPGKFRGQDGRIDFINQTGDMKLDINAEYRTHLFWKFDAAAFVDAGNIWTLREYTEQPGGQFRWNEFYKQIAVAYGLGLRLNFDYFILRFDAGMKAVNPAYEDSKEHYAIVHPNLRRDFKFHFAVGFPF